MSLIKIVLLCLTVAVSGISCAKKKVTDTTGPTAPTSVTLGGRMATDLVSTPTISWVASTDDGDGASGVSYYQVAIYKGSDNTLLADWRNLTSGDKISDLAGSEVLTSGNEFYFKVRAVDVAGNIGTEAVSSNFAACPTNFVLTPKMTGYTTQDFCVAKFEMKNVSSVATSQAVLSPWVDIPRGTDGTTAGGAWKACKDLGAAYSLISNAEWQTLARNIESVASNWSGGTVGSGGINRGNSNGSNAYSVSNTTDPYDQTGKNSGQAFGGGWEQKRTHTLSNGEVIWDLAGNVYEWVRDDYANLGIDPAISSGWNELSSLSANNITILGPSGSYTSANGMGEFYGGTGGAVFRGGNWMNSTKTGIYSGQSNNGAAVFGNSIGFRCVYE